ncbi:hypothetical protein [Leucobacter iarius]|uniref:CHAP domain-containing protein n=1 Tax=Leucobacter iarius TaxID=333963 RepID=A0ABN2LJT3_9MICO
MTFNLDAWADGIDGRLLDLDAAPAQQPAQCHDVWLSYLYALGGKPGDGHAPGAAGWTSEVWKQYPTHRPNLAKLFTRHGPSGIRRGDVVFWSAYDGAGLPHVAVALADAGPTTVECLTQNPGPVHREHLSRRGVLGVLRPITKTKPAPPAPTHQKGTNMFMIYRKIGRDGIAWAVVGPGFFLEVPTQTEASAINKQLSGGSAPAALVSDARWAQHKAAAAR